MSIFVMALSAAIVMQAPSGKSPEPQPAAKGVPAETIFEKELGRLTPGDATAYFELGELVAAEAVDYADVMLAKRLFVLAYEFDRTAKGQSGIAASSCIALASLQPLSKDRAWLLSIATLIDPRYAVGSDALADEAVVAPAIGYQAATVLGMVRAGEGFAARNLLEQPEVLQVLRRYERMLSTNGMLGALNRLKSEAGKWPCQTCVGARFTKSPGSTDARKCPTCDALPGWKLNEAELEAQLSLESKLLSGIQLSWAAQVLSDDDAPLRDSDPSSVAAALAIDVKKTVYRAGSWVNPVPDTSKVKSDTVTPK